VFPFANLTTDPPTKVLRPFFVAGDQTPTHLAIVVNPEVRYGSFPVIATEDIRRPLVRAQPTNIPRNADLRYFWS
jgi:hypothetical protein